jgi:hypothetical protein
MTVNVYRHYKTEDQEVCEGCGAVIPATEAQDTAAWLLIESDYTLEEGPLCSTCARHRRAGQPTQQEA